MIGRASLIAGSPRAIRLQHASIHSEQLVLHEVDSVLLVVQ